MYLFFVVVVGWGNDQLTGFGEERGVKHQTINLIHSIRTVMRSKLVSGSCMPVYRDTYQYIYILTVFFFVPVPLIFLNVVTMVLLLLMG